MSTSIGCIYNVPLDITEEDSKDVLKQKNVSNCVRLTYFNKEIKERRPSTTVKLYFNVPNSLLEYLLVLGCIRLKY